MKTWLLLLALCSPARAEDFAVLVRDRTTVERVYYNHRLGEKPPFEQVSPPSLIERLVREDLHKEAALKQVYRVDVTPAMLDAEVQRINTTTRAPEMLAEIKAALGNDPAKIANVFARPILVERLLRDKFENDDALHAPQRRGAEEVRAQLLQMAMQDLTGARLALLKQNHSNAVSETTWQLGERPAETNAPGRDERTIKQNFGPNVQVISSPQRDSDRKCYFEDLPAELQNVLRVQLRQPGDMSAVIETPGGFLLYVAKEKSKAVLTAACLSLPKRNYEQWLSEQPETQ